MIYGLAGPERSLHPPRLSRRHGARSIVVQGNEVDVGVGSDERGGSAAPATADGRGLERPCVLAAAAGREPGAPIVSGIFVYRPPSGTGSARSPARRR